MRFIAGGINSRERIVIRACGMPKRNRCLSARHLAGAQFAESRPDLLEGSLNESAMVPGGAKLDIGRARHAANGSLELLIATAEVFEKFGEIIPQHARLFLERRRPDN